MSRLQIAPFVIGRIRSRDPELLLLDPDAPDTWEFLRNAVLSGTIRAIPAGRGKVAILPMVEMPRVCPRPAPGR